jgi:soluble lytic murein transglycosylase
MLIYGAIVAIRNYIEEASLPVEYSEIIEAVSKEEGVTESIIYAVIYTESKFDKDSKSSAGAVGLMQLLPSTAEWLCQTEGAEYDESMLTDPEFSIKYGTKYLKILYDRYKNWDAAHAAYHAGFSRVDSWLKEGTAKYNEDGQLVGIPIESTEQYVNKIRETRERYYKRLEEIKNEK